LSAILTTTKSFEYQQYNDEENKRHTERLDKKSYAWLADPKDLASKSPKSLGSCSKDEPRDVIEKNEMKAYINDISNNKKFDSVQRYTMFFANGRSGHSWTGAILDASPNAMVANQKHALELYDKGAGREEIYTALAYNSYLCGKHGWLQVYNYTIPGLWQGKVDDYNQLQVIGDKRGGNTLDFILELMERKLKHSSKFDFIFGNYNDLPERKIKKYLQGFLDTIQNEPRFVVVLRHPANVITTLAFRNSRHTFDSAFDLALSRYRALFWAMENIGKPNQWHVLRTEDFATDTEGELLNLCNFVGISCPTIMIEKVIQQTHHEVHDTWKSINWKQSDMAILNKFVTNYMSDYYNPINPNV